nr:hypothetical protein [Micromonospora sp. DSM 115978]
RHRIRRHSQKECGRAMKAIVQDRFGPPEVLRFTDVEVPQVGDRDVLVQVRAAAVNPYDWHLMRGDPKIARLMGMVGVTKPKSRSVVIDVAGVVSAVGPEVPDLPGLRPGDEVFGFCQGAFAEFACAETDRLVPKPARLSFEQAAALPMAATT